MKDNQYSKRISLKALLGISSVSWATPIVYSLSLPAHAELSPQLHLSILSVTISQEPGGATNIRNVSFDGVGEGDGDESLEDAIVTVTISTNTDSNTFTVMAGGPVSGLPVGAIEVDNASVGNSSGGDITIRIETSFPFPALCESVSVSNSIGTTNRGGLQVNVC